jgi:catechol 2,3-dioxygenase-like lactoylglutathione lyase family enzyme
MKLNHTAVVSRSQENADRFFEGILGLKKIKSSDLPEDIAAAVFGQAIACGLLLYEGRGFAVEVIVQDAVQIKGNPFVHLCLEVGDREAFLARCRSVGLRVNLVPKGDAVLCFVEDFDGNLYEIKELAA